MLLNQHAHVSSLLAAALWLSYMSAKGFWSNKDGIKGELKASELALDCSIHSLRAGMMCKPQGAHVLAFLFGFSLKAANVERERERERERGEAGPDVDYTRCEHLVLNHKHHDALLFYLGDILDVARFSFGQHRSGIV